MRVRGLARQHLNVGKNLAKAWANEARPLFLDLKRMPIGQLISDGTHPVEFVAIDALKRNVGECCVEVGWWVERPRGGAMRQLTHA